MAKDSGNQLGVIPEFLVERPGQTFNSYLIPFFILVLEVIALFSRRRRYF
jgi:hypothetical protein